MSDSDIDSIGAPGASERPPGADVASAGFPAAEPSPAPSRPFGRTVAVVETIAALAVAMLVTGLVTLPFVPIELGAEFSVEPVVDGASAQAAELVSRVRDLGVAEGVRWVGGGSGTKLLLTGVREASGFPESVHEALREAGFGESRMRRRPSVDEQGLFRETAREMLTLQALVFVAIGALLARWRLRPRSRAATRAGATVLLGLGGGLAAFTSSVLIGLVLQAVGLPVQEQEWVRELFRQPDFVLRLAPWVVLIVPVAEEIFFRGYIFRFLTERAGLTAGLVVSSTLFAIVHFNPSGFVVYLAIGVVLAVVYLKSSSLVAPVLAHMVHNGIVLAVALAASISA